MPDLPSENIPDEIKEVINRSVYLMTESIKSGNYKNFRVIIPDPNMYAADFRHDQLRIEFTVPIATVVDL